MLKDEDIIPVCRLMSKRFIRQGLKILGGSREDVLNELINTAYVSVKPLNDMKAVKTWIVWKLSEYLASPVDTSTKHSGVLIDKRYRLHRYEPSPREILQANEEREILLKCLKELSPSALNTLSMRFKDGMTYEEIGEVCGFSRVKIANDIKSSLAELREMMVKKT